MNRPVPFEAFDAGWPLVIVCGACLLFYALFWLTDSADDAGEPVEHPDPTSPEDRLSLEDDARRTPF